MGFGTTFSMLSFLLIFAGMTIFVINVQTSVTGAATAIQQQSQTSLEAQQQAIQITNTNVEQNKEVFWKLQYQDEFVQGEFNQTYTQADRIQTNSSGEYYSPMYNTGYPSNYTTLSYNAVGVVSFQIRSANTTAQLQAADFLGPDATTTTNYSFPQTINNVHNNDQYIQYKATLQTNTSQLQDTTIGVQRQTTHITLQVQNTGSKKLRPEETDVYIDGIRKARSSQNRELHLQNNIDARLWNPAEELNVTVFSTTPAMVTINNDRAQAVEMV